VVQPYEHMFVLGPRSPHIPFPRAEAALRAGQLGWILAHEAQISMNLEYELEVCRLIAVQDPEQLERASAEWLVGFAKRLVARCDEAGLGQ
jgi:hypothetical protein